MSAEGFFLQAFVYLAAAVVAVPLAKRLGLGSVLGYLVAGLVIGPFGLGFVGAEGEDVMHFAEFGVVMMLFVIGLELEPALLWRLRRPILGLGGLQVLLTTTLFTGVAIAVGLAWPQALAVGMTLSLSSTAIVLQTLAERGQLKTTGGQSAFSVLLFQDVAVIPMLALMPLLAGGAHGAAGEGAGHEAATTWIAGMPAWMATLTVLGAVAAIVVGGRYLLHPLFRVLGSVRMREVFTAASLLLVIGIALLMSKVGLSPALGTFLAGVVLANSEYRHELEADVEPFKGLLLGLFFISVGASMDVGLVVERPGLVGGMAAGIVALKFGVLAVLARVFGMGLDEALLFALALPQVGEFGFVLFSFANQEGVLGAAVTDPLVASVALSMAVTPLLLIANERILRPRFGTRQAPERDPDRIEDRSPVLIAGFGAFGSTLGRLLTANRIPTTVLDIDSERVELLRSVGLEVYYGDATRSDLLDVAGAGEAALLVIAVDSPEKTMEVARTALHDFPNLTVMARAFDWQDAHELLQAGVHRVYRENLDASLRMGAEALTMFGFRAYQAERATQKFLRHDEESVRELTAVRGEDRSRYLSAVRQRIQDLEALLRADLGGRELDRDAGWDPESVRADFGGAPED